MEFRVKTIEKDLNYLKQISKEVDFKDENYKQEIEILAEYSRTKKLLAIAAIQLGIPKRMIYIRNTDLKNIGEESIDESRILINPVIISRKGKTKYWEACASCLDNMGLVTRPYEIVIEYQDIDENKKIEIFTGFEATVLSHEYDHLNGILHIDIAEQILNMPQEERKKFRENHPYEIISKDCIFEEA